MYYEDDQTKEGETGRVIDEYGRIILKTVLNAV
jgi:hypothetical protein